MPLPSLPSSLPMCLLFPLFILPACAFISVYATHIVPLHYLVAIFFIQHELVYTYKPLLSLINPFRFPAPFLLFFPGFVVSINIFLWLVPPLSFLPCFISQFCFNCHIPCTTYLPLLFAHFVLFLSCFVRFVITCTAFLPFPCFIYFYLTVQCRLTHVDFAFKLYPIPFDVCLVLSYHQYPPSHASPSPVPLSFPFVSPVSFIC